MNIYRAHHFTFSTDIITTLRYEKKVLTVMVNNSNNTNNHLAPQLIEHKKDNDIWQGFWLGIGTPTWRN